MAGVLNIIAREFLEFKGALEDPKTQLGFRFSL